MIDHAFSSTVSAFARYGTASEDINDFSSCLSIGMRWAGALSSRPDDVFAIGLSKIQTSPVLKKTSTDFAAEESTIEVSYLFQVTNGFSVQPDMQFVTDPSASKSIEDAQVAAVRFELEF